MPDYKGQMWSEYIYYFLTIFFGAVAWIVGYVQEDFNYTVYGWSVGLVLSLLLCIPDWPFFNRNPVQWLDEVGTPLKLNEEEVKVSKKKKVVKAE